MKQRETVSEIRQKILAKKIGKKGIEILSTNYKGQKKSKEMLVRDMLIVKLYNENEWALRDIGGLMGSVHPQSVLQIVRKYPKLIKARNNKQ